MRSGQAVLAAACFAAVVMLAALPAMAADGGQQQAIQAHLDRASELMMAASGGGKPPRRNVEAAIKEIEAVIPVDPTNYLAHQLYGYAVYLMGDDKFAIGQFTMAIRHNPQSAEAYLGRAFAEYDACYTREALIDETQAMKLDRAMEQHVIPLDKLKERVADCKAMIAAANAPHPQAEAKPSTWMDPIVQSSIRRTRCYLQKTDLNNYACR
jgi:tetratricopeptide (TPR) repeat protein